MRGWRRSVAALVGVLGLLAVSAGCSPTVASTGQRLADADRPLQTALTKLKKDNEAGIQNNSITVSSSTDCFYRKASRDADGISDQVVCGPIRRLGLPDDRVWDSYRLTFSSDSDGKAVATVGSHTAQGIAVDTGLLVSPSGDEPADVADVPAPRAPQTSVTDHAVAVAADAAPAGLGFTQPAHPAKLITPAATVTVTGVAEPKTVPEALVAGQNDPAGKAAYYLPATGQRLYAYQLEISAPRDADLPVGTSARTQTKDPATALGLRVAGDKAVPITDRTGATTSTSTLTVPCAARNSSRYPCKPRTSTIIVLMTVPASGAVSLTATSAGGDQSVDLASGTVSSHVSTVEYQRSRLTADVGKRLKVRPYEVTLQSSEPPADEEDPDDKDAPDDEKSDGQDAQTARPKPVTATARWAMTVDSVALSAFDPHLGWAPEGQAWMILSTSKYQRKDGGATFTDHRASSLSVTVDGTAHPVQGLTDDDLADHPDDDVSWIFAVPADADTATVTFRPTGTARASRRSGSSTADFTADFTADPAATVDVDLPK